MFLAQDGRSLRQELVGAIESAFVVARQESRFTDRVPVLLVRQRLLQWRAALVDDSLALLEEEGVITLFPADADELVGGDVADAGIFHGARGHLVYITRPRRLQRLGALPADTANWRGPVTKRRQG